MLSGSITALVTPFKNDAVDEAAFQALVERQIEAGTHGVVPVGTTGESPTLSTEEKKRVIALTVEAVAGRVPVIAGTGSNNTAASVEMHKWAKSAGVDAALVVAPYYNKPSQEGLFRHFEAIARSEVDKRHDAIKAVADEAMASEDYKEGVAAFAANRDPVFKGK